MFRATDLCSDADLRAYEPTILTQFGRVEWADLRAKALSDWLWPLLEAEKFPVERFRTRYVADKVFGCTASTYTDKTDDAHDTDSDDLNLAAIFATVGTDALYVGSTKPFRGLSIRLSDSVSAVTSTMTVSLWTDAWESVSIQDGTSRTSGKTFSGGGAVTWRVPEGWVPRVLNGSDPLYWAKVTVSATPTGATAGQIGVIRDSRLSGPATLKTLELVFIAAPTTQDGPWERKAEQYGRMAQEAWERVKPTLGKEFDTGIVDDLVSPAEAAQTNEEVTQGGWTLERG